MKNKILFAGIVLFLVSCGSENASKNEKPSGNKDTVQISETQVVYEPIIEKGRVKVSIGKGENRQESSIAYQYYKITDESPVYEENINAFISLGVVPQIGEENEVPSVKNLKPSYFQKQLKDFKNDFEEINDDTFGTWYMWDSTDIDESYKEFVQVRRFNAYFTGGAHGSAFNSTSLFNRESGEPMKLEDVVKDVKKLMFLGDKYLRKGMEIAPDANLEEEGFWFEKGFELNENFEFTDKYMVFTYNQYEIGPYAMGIISVEIPISKVKPLLKISLDKTK